MRLQQIHKSVSAILAAAGLSLASTAQAHFQMIIPSDDMVEQGESRQLNLDVLFWHPFEGHGMNMAKPIQFGVMNSEGQKQDLIPSLQPKQRKDAEGKMLATFTAKYDIKKPGDYIFYIEPQPYWEPSEDKFIVHYTKVIVDGFGLEEGWNQEVGLKAEIVPLTRPYGLWTNNVFQGVVKMNGKPVPNGEVEVEYFNQDGKTKAPAGPMITQVIKADVNGVFTYAMPKAGWWGFAALNEGDKKIKYEGKEYPVEIGALLWVKTHDMK